MVSAGKRFESDAQMPARHHFGTQMGGGVVRVLAALFRNEK
jgi:hypothetical protein